MRATGIVRRFDDLGRIVIPKELRKQLFGTPEKSEGMPMEIFMDKDEIILRKYVENVSDDVSSFEELVTNARTKAIDDLLEDANEMTIEVDTGTYTMKAVGIGLLEQIAEQLKEGGKNVNS